MIIFLGIYFTLNAFIAGYSFYTKRSIPIMILNVLIASLIIVLFSLYAFVMLFKYKANNDYEGYERFINSNGKTT